MEEEKSGTGKREIDFHGNIRVTCTGAVCSDYVRIRHIILSAHAYALLWIVQLYLTKKTGLVNNETQPPHRQGTQDRTTYVCPYGFVLQRLLELLDLLLNLQRRLLSLRGRVNYSGLANFLLLC